MSRLATRLIRDYHFWLVLVISVAIGVTHHLTREPLPVLHEIIEQIVVLPVIYAAFRFGLRGALLTVVLVNVAILVSGFLDFDFDEISNDFVMAVVSLGIAAVLGWLVEQEKTARKEQTRVATELTQFIDTANAPIIGLDRSGLLNEWNQKAIEITGYSKDEVLGHNMIEEFITEDYKTTVREVRDKALRGEGTTSFEFPLRTKDGKQVELLFNATTRRDVSCNIVGVLGVGQDITERIKIQKEQENLLSAYREQSEIITDSNVKLEKALDTVKESEDELQQLYQQEKGLRAELQAEIKKRSEFTRALVHELKTPLVPIIASSDMLVDGLKDEPWLSMAKNIERGATNLSQRVDELLDIARGEVGILKVNLKAIDPLPLLREVAEEMGAVASHREQSLVTDLPSSLPLIQADYSRLRQVLLNLLNNASKFTPPGGEISLRTKGKDGTLIVEVQDTGPGIPEQEQRRIFDTYYQLASEGQQFKGMGIGLSLCKKLVELHGGQIAVESKAGKGSIFRFSVPLAPSDRQAKDGSNTGVTKILIIEDNWEVVTAISLALQVYWPEVELIFTHFGETGIQMAKDEAPDAIILDLGLPDISGFQVLSQIRSLSSVPVIILTASAREGDRIKGFELGANDYIVKPFKQREFIETLKAQVTKTVSETVKSTI